MTDFIVNFKLSYNQIYCLFALLICVVAYILCLTTLYLRYNQVEQKKKNSSITFFFQFVCVCVCVHVCIYMGHMWRPQDYVDFTGLDLTGCVERQFG